MNLLLLDTTAPRVTLAAADERARHLREVLRVAPGRPLDVGVPGGPRGRAVVEGVAPDGAVTLRCAFLAEDPPDILPVHLLLAAQRPIEGRRLLEDAATAGVAAVTVFAGERGEPGYFAAAQWREEEAAAALRRGAAQGFSTWIPAFSRHASLAAALAACPAGIVLDVYEAPEPLRPGDASGGNGPVGLALGPERGWSDAERAAFRAAGWRFRHLGPRVLRTSHATHAALALLQSALGPTRSHLEAIAALRSLDA